MTTISIGCINNISVETTLYETKIDICDMQGTHTQLEMTRLDVEYLLSELAAVLNKVKREKRGKKHETNKIASVEA